MVLENLYGIMDKYFKDSGGQALKMDQVNGPHLRETIMKDSGN